MPDMRNANHRLLKGVFAGMVGGLVASWVMNRFQSGVSKVQKTWEETSRHEEPKKQQSSDAAATELVAQRLSHLILGRDLTPEEMKFAEPFVHYAFGTLSGGFYGLASELAPAAKKGAGSLFGTLLWIAADEIAVPMLRLSKSPAQYGIGVHAEALASHLVYGFTTEEIRRGLRAVV